MISFDGRLLLVLLNYQYLDLILRLLNYNINCYTSAIMAPSHAEIWDDSALVNSWNDALEEYKVIQNDKNPAHERIAKSSHRNIIALRPKERMWILSWNKLTMVLPEGKCLARILLM